MEIRTLIPLECHEKRLWPKSFCMSFEDWKRPSG